MSDWNGDTHCPYCEKPIADDAQYDEAERIENEFGEGSKESADYDAQFCWNYPTHQCSNYDQGRWGAEDAIDRRIRELLTERDMLRAALTIYGERQNWHYERWPSEYVHPNELNLYSWVGDGFRAPWQLANKVLEKDGDT
jgi:hypothetical protein